MLSMASTADCSNFDVNTLNNLQCKGIRLLHCNIRSLRKNFNRLIELLADVNYNFDLICLSETFLYENEHSLFPIPNYTFIGDSRASRCGGSGIYVHSGIAVSEVLPVSLAGAEAVSVRLAGAGEGPLYLTSIYRSPSSDVGGFLNDLNVFLGARSQGSRDHIITGDLNINTLNSESADYLDMIHQYNFTNLITVPTRITETSKTCIDHILINFISPNITCGTILKDTSDHLPVFAFFEENNLNKPFNKIKMRSKLYKLEDLHSRLERVDWKSQVYDVPCVDQAYENFLKVTSDIFDSVAPKIEFQPKGSRHPKSPWITDTLLAEIKSKNKLFCRHKAFPFSPKHKISYSRQRNKVSTLIKKAKTAYYENLISKQSDTSKLWKVINKACGRKISPDPAIHKIIDPVLKELNNSGEIASAFNKFFTEIGPKLASTIPNQIKSITTNIDYSSFDFLSVEEDTVYREITNLNEFKAEGLDGVSPKLVKESAVFIAAPLTNIINRSIQDSIVPAKMKSAKVLPIYKNKGSKVSVNNYRPISILPIYSKIFEKIINLQIQNHLGTENIISEFQYGFQRKKGTHDALIKFVSNAFNALNSSQIILGIFIDFSKAFDTINHDILIDKLSAINFSVKSIKLIKNYLTNRTQAVSLNGITSRPLAITCGVPQGSILGPTLFLLYINDLILSATNFSPILFADDTNLFFQSKNLNQDATQINLGLDEVKSWCFANKLTLNIEKTNYIIIKNPQNPFILFEKFAINETNINNANSIKFLGITIDKNLNWSSHIENLRKQLRQSLGLIYQASSFLPLSVLILLYNSLVNSKIVFCLEAWGNAPKTHLNKILIIQKRLLRIMFHKKQEFHSTPLFQEAKILPIFELYTLRICLLAHSEFYNSSRDQLTPTYATRHSALALPLPRFLSACGQRHITYQMSAAWNSLPTFLREMSGRDAFKAALKRHLLDSLP
jgi:exonuclease III